MTEIQTEKLENIKPDLTNANRHTERGNAMLRNSMSEFGFAEAGTLDANNRIIGGNHRTEVAADVLGSEDATIVEHDGKKPIYIKLPHVDLDTEEGRRLAYSLNRVAQTSISFDPEQVMSDIQGGINLDGIFNEREIDDLLAGIEGRIVDDPQAEWEGMPEFEQEDNFGAVTSIKVHFSSKEDVEKFAEVVGQSVTDKSTFIWFPKKDNEDLQPYRVIDES